MYKVKHFLIQTFKNMYIYPKKKTLWKGTSAKTKQRKSFVVAKDKNGGEEDVLADRMNMSSNRQKNKTHKSSLPHKVSILYFSRHEIKIHYNKFTMTKEEEEIEREM